jgi:hypothetical protein
MSIRNRVERAELCVAEASAGGELCTDEACVMREAHRAVDEAYGKPPCTSEAANHPPSLCRGLGEKLEKLSTCGYVEALREITGGAACQ